MIEGNGNVFWVGSDLRKPYFQKFRRKLRNMIPG
jgi:hypothetical protein